MYEWTGAVDDSYWNGANWSPLALPNGPGPTDDVTFDSVSAPTCRIGLAPNNQPYKVNSLWLEGVDFLSNPTVEVNVPNFEVTSRLEIQAGTLGMALAAPPLQNVASVVTVPDGGRFLWSGGTISGITLKLNVTPHQLELNESNEPHLISGDSQKTLTDGAKILATGAQIRWEGNGNIQAFLGSAGSMPSIDLDEKKVRLDPNNPDTEWSEKSKLFITGGGSMTNQGGQAKLINDTGGRSGRAVAERLLSIGTSRTSTFS